MITKSNSNPIENRELVRRDRNRPSRHAMLQKTLIVLAGSGVLGIATIAPNAALAFGPPPLPGLAGPHLALGGPPPGLRTLPHPGLGAAPHFGSGTFPQAGTGGLRGLSDLRGSAGWRGGGRGIEGDLHGRAGGEGGYGRFARSNYGYSYGRNGWRNRAYGAYVEGIAASAYANDGCYYTYSYSRHTRILACATTE